MVHNEAVGSKTVQDWESPEWVPAWAYDDDEEFISGEKLERFKQHIAESHPDIPQSVIDAAYIESQ